MSSPAAAAETAVAPATPPPAPPPAAEAPANTNKRVVTVEDIQQRYKFWRKYVSTLYDVVSTHTLNAPVPCIEIIDIEKGDWTQLLGSSNNNSEAEWNKRHSRLLAVGTAGYDTQSSIEFFRVDIPSPTSDTASPSQISKVRTKSLFSASTGGTSLEDELLVFRPNPTRSTLLASTSPNGLQVWDFEGRSADFKCVELSKAYGQAIAWQQDKLLLGTHNGGIFLFDVAAEKQVKSQVSFSELSSSPHSGSAVFAVECSSPDEFISASNNGSICSWDLRQKDSVGQRNSNAHSGFGVSCLSTLRNGTQFLSGAGLNAQGKGPSTPEVKLWDMRNLQEHIAIFTCNSSSSLHPDDHGSSVHQVRWNPHHDSEFAACSEDGSVRLWDKGKVGGKADEDGPAELLFVHAGHVGAVTDFQWDPQFNRTVISASDENIMVWRPLLNSF